MKTSIVKKVVSVTILIIAIVSLSGCLDTFKELPTDTECRVKITDHLLELVSQGYVGFYDVNDEIYLEDWEGVIGCKDRKSVV